MTLKTSLFNKGIYKSTVRRYLWGSILYFVILFVTTALPIFMMVDPRDVSNYIGYSMPIIYDITLPSALIAMFVPTVVGLLVFRFMHSKKTSIFIHSLPISRTGIYFSTVLGALTLMMVPVILNGGILAIMALTSYERIFSFSSVIVWILINLLTLFTMFSCTCFVSSITGNSFAMIALNILFHGFIPLVVAAFGVFAECFLFGFADVSDLLSKVADGNLVYRLTKIVDDLYDTYRNGIAVFGLGNLIEIIAAIVLYALGWLLYKNRNLEKAEDVAGFKVLNPIFKYLITFLAAICAFAIFSQFITENLVAFIIIIAIISLVSYVATEMVLKKTLRVWGSYKGFIGFVAMFVLMTTVCAYTNVFGFETRVPDAERVESVAVYNYYNNDEPFVADKDVINQVISLHKEIVSPENIYIIRSGRERYYTRLHMKYKLTNGKELNRVYYVSEKKLYEIMGTLYEIDNFKIALEDYAAKKPEDIIRINLYGDEAGSVSIDSREEIKGFHEALKKDIMALDYSQIRSQYNKGSSLHVAIESRVEDLDLIADVKIAYGDTDINMNFKNTHKWLNENGYKEFSYYDKIKGTVYIANDKALNEGYEIASERAALLKSPEIPESGCAYFSEITKEKLREYMIENYFSYLPEEETYVIYHSLEHGGYGVICEVDKKTAEGIIEKIFN